MAVGRYFAGPVIHKLNPVGVLLASSILTTFGIFFMSQASGNQVYFAAILFALGVTYFWPTMLGCVAEYTPNTGPLGLSLIGGTGMFAVSMWNPVIGSWIDAAREQTTTLGLAPELQELAVGQAVLSKLMLFPMVLILVFALLYYLLRNSHTPSAPAVEVEAK